MTSGACAARPVAGGQTGNETDRWSREPDFMRVEPGDQGANLSLGANRFLSILN